MLVIWAIFHFFQNFEEANFFFFFLTRTAEQERTQKIEESLIINALSIYDTIYLIECYSSGNLHKCCLSGNLHEESVSAWLLDKLSRNDMSNYQFAVKTSMSKRVYCSLLCVFLTGVTVSRYYGAIQLYYGYN